jgi:site-specific DNA-methyltransferase (adenine-specific)
MHRCLVADPPWRFDDKLPGPGRGAASHYDVLSNSDIENFELPLLADDCYLFLWRVSSMVEEAYRVCRAWGFIPKTELVWIKRTKNGKRWFGMGHHLRAEHESCIVAVRGRPKPLLRNIRTTFGATAGRHSAKPDEFYDLVESFCEGPYVELFARRTRPGWVTLGNDPDLLPKTQVG